MNVQEISALLTKSSYVADDSLAEMVWMGLTIDRPLLLEGEAGVGKTAIAQACATGLNRPLLRLQCHESLDLNQAVYEWNYSRQLLEIRLREAEGGDKSSLRDDLFSQEFLLQRPLMQAITSLSPAVLLIDEIDRADEAFEAYLLEVLGEFQITVPELGTIKAKSHPLVILTSNGTRDLSDALRRRCLYHYVDYPTVPRELNIVKALLPNANLELVQQAVLFVHQLRKEDLDKTPGIAETLDWIRVLCAKDLTKLPEDPAELLSTLSALLKTRSDQWQISDQTLNKLMGSNKRVGIDAGVVASRN
ncbi:MULTISPECIES: MoxR family ATPase [unclassified Polynucleobacter]|jgi:MoxR-like ATPase|uniref:AAA family ATPase n=1 Tax=unclassified Polynucleobacter TaxID=2640945 RepID=UPI00092C1677|nr:MULTISPECIES: MoxR family ATPase [unclassified Polynucleobacter]MEA9602108.1 MoxR family ATPase [Polynucleobacter sp. MG-28-Ekke-A2]OJI04534.1 ATPase [Polynucleobacter sp. MWH-Adler-W8]